MSFAEAGVVVDVNHKPIFWHVPFDRSAWALKDSRPLWDILWEAHQAKTLLGFAHSHPGSGMPHPSIEDISTFRAVEKGLGAQLSWWITSSDILTRVEATSPALVKASNTIITLIASELEPPWVKGLRERSQHLIAVE